MRAVVQRVKEAWVEVKGTRVSSIETGLLVYLGVHSTDEPADVAYICEKVVGLRVFEDSANKMNLSIQEAGGSLLVVSQFTLYGDCRKGKRPSFAEAASPEKARALYELMTAKCREHGVAVETGIFREMMNVYSINDGPVTLLLDSGKMF
ncbi:MAG: D-aminoacyl-tRNA deacylase [Acidobacteria bacterium]|nr:D-aminoacyl-tRNA deacylase [Acidobacteriota bacterium]MCI0626883.1 D-aminoacyl-tRNA deacylase [Acidobacteriota bacterium]